jgi:hypothetical protein
MPTGQEVGSLQFAMNEQSCFGGEDRFHWVGETPKQCETLVDRPETSEVLNRGSVDYGGRGGSMRRVSFPLQQGKSGGASR